MKHLTVITIALIFTIFLLKTSPAVGSENMEEMGNLFEGDILGIAPSLLSKNGKLGKKFRWPNATIPYHFDTGYPTYMRQLFLRATKYISHRTCIKFVKWTNQEDYVFVKSDQGCSSFVGRIGGPQSRSDRDKWVSIRWENIQEEQRYNFKAYSVNEVSPFGVPYDYSSVMHYGRKAFSKNKKDTIIPRVEGAIIGQRKGMSPGDIQKVRNMYCK